QSTARPWSSSHCAAIAWRMRGRPGIGAYWFRSAAIASAAARLTNSGPAKSGKPWPRLTAPCWTASALISVKIVVPKPATRRARGADIVAILLCSILYWPPLWYHRAGGAATHMDLDVHLDRDGRV